MIGAASMDAKTNRGNLAVVYIDPGGILTGSAVNAIGREKLSNGCFDTGDRVSDATVQSANVKQRIGYQLPGAMPGDLSTTVGSYDRDVNWVAQVCGIAIQAEGENWRVLKEPDFVPG